MAFMTQTARSWLGRMPNALTAPASWLFGSYCFLTDRHGCRRSTAATIGAALGCTRRQALWLTLRQNCNAVRYALDSFRFDASSDDEILARLRDDGGDSAKVLDHLRHGQGVILATTFFACLRYVLLIGLLRARTAGARLLVVRPGPDPAFDSFAARAEAISGHPLEIVQLDQPNAALRVRSALRGGAVVVCLIDNIIDGASLVATSMFGRPSCLIVGHLLIAQRLGAPVYLCYGRSEGAGISLVLHGPMLADPRLPPAEAVEDLAATLAGRLESAVRAAPQQWEGWDALRKNWAIGAHLIQDDQEEELVNV